MRNARKRRMKRKHGNHPAKPRPWSTIKLRPAPPIAVAKAKAKPASLSLDQL